MNKYSVSFGRELMCPWIRTREWYFLSNIAESFYVVPDDFGLDYDKELEVQPATFNIRKVKRKVFKSESTIARNFKSLVDKGILSRKREGREFVYEFTGREEMLRYMKLDKYLMKEASVAYSEGRYEDYERLNEEMCSLIDLFRSIKKEERDKYLTAYEEKYNYPEALSFGFIEWVQEEDGSYRSKVSFCFTDEEE